MKKLKASALVILAVLIAAAAMSGCNIYIGGQPSSSNGSSSSSSSTTEAPTTEQPTTVEVTTEVPTTEEPQTEAPKSEYSTESNGEAVLVDNEKYHDSYLGITFTMPDWVGNVYAKSQKANGSYILGFYEKTNYDLGQAKNWSGFGMLFEVNTSDKEITQADIIYPAGSELVDGKTVYLCYFKPTDVRFDPRQESTYRAASAHQRDYFTSGVVDADRIYVPSPAKFAMNLKSE